MLDSETDIQNGERKTRNKTKSNSNKKYFFYFYFFALEKLYFVRKLIWRNVVYIVTLCGRLLEMQ